MATDGAALADWTAIVRDDRTRQWADEGTHFYTFAKDKSPAEINGDGVNSVWHIAAP